MNLFDYFDEEHKVMEENLVELEKNYLTWSHERVFVRASKLFDGINRHFDRQETLLLQQLTEIPELEDVITACERDREELLGLINDLVMDHIDSPDWRENLGKLLKAFRKHIEFSDKELYKTIKEVLSESKLKQLHMLMRIKLFA